MSENDEVPEPEPDDEHELLPDPPPGVGATESNDTANGDDDEGAEEYG